MFLLSRVLPTPLGPSKTRFRPSRRNSRARARSSRDRSIFLGQFQSKSAMDLNAPSRLLRVRRSRERLERSVASVRTISSSRARGARRFCVARARRSSTPAAVACKPMAWSCVTRSLIGALLVGSGLGKLVISAQAVRLYVQGSELGSLGEIDGQGWTAVGGAAVLFEQKLDRSEVGSATLQSLGESAIECLGAIELEQAGQMGDQHSGATMVGKGGIEEAFSFGRGEAQRRAGGRAEGSTFLGEQSFGVGRIGDALTLVIAAAVSSDLFTLFDQTDLGF